jgi:hypothetical protein
MYSIFLPLNITGSSSSSKYLILQCIFYKTEFDIESIEKMKKALEDYVNNNS